MEAERKINNHQTVTWWFSLEIYHGQTGFPWPQPCETTQKCCLLYRHGNRVKTGEKTFVDCAHTQAACLSHQHQLGTITTHMMLQGWKQEPWRNISLMLFWVTQKKVGKESCRWRKTQVDVFLPNCHLVSEPEHTVCENATWLSAAPFLSGGWFAL